MIWVRKSHKEFAEQRRSFTARAFSWLLFQTCFFGIACFIILQISATTQPVPSWLQPMLTVSLIGFAGGMVGSLITFALLSARDSASDAEFEIKIEAEE
jgi:branched-subunit amino acid permease